MTWLCTELTAATAACTRPAQEPAKVPARLGERLPRPTPSWWAIGNWWPPVGGESVFFWGVVTVGCLCPVGPTLMYIWAVLISERFLSNKGGEFLTVLSYWGFLSNPKSTEAFFHAKKKKKNDTKSFLCSGTLQWVPKVAIICLLHGFFFRNTDNIFLTPMLVTAVACWVQAPELKTSAISSPSRINSGLDGLNL